jgi:hypothetical protein
VPHEFEYSSPKIKGMTSGHKLQNGDFIENSSTDFGLISVICGKSRMDLIVYAFSNQQQSAQQKSITFLRLRNESLLCIMRKFSHRGVPGSILA